MTASISPIHETRADQLRSMLVSIDALSPSLEANYLVQGWLGDGGFSVIYGKSNVGKTFVALDLAVHVASESDWQDRTVKGGAVVYVAAEGGAGIVNRLAAIKKAKPEIAIGADFFLLPMQLDLHGEEDADAFCEALPSRDLALIVIDTMARSMGSGDENSVRDVSQFIANLDKIRRRTGAHIMVVHHAGKEVSKGARGSSALLGAIDTEIEVVKGKIKCTKQRDMENSGEIYFRIQTVCLGEDSGGHLVSSAIVVNGDVPKESAKLLPPMTEVALNLLKDACRSEGVETRISEIQGTRLCVSLETWRRLFFELGLYEGRSESARRMAFKRAKDRLFEAQAIGVLGEWVWLNSGD